MAAQSTQRGCAPDLVKILGIPLVIVIAILAWWRPWQPPVYTTSSPDEVYTVVAGTWDWASAEEWCSKNPHSLSFSADRSVMRLAFRTPWKDSTGTEHRVSEYDIRGHTASSIQGAIRGEKRLTDAGVPVVWNLVLTSPNSYRWHRTDWPSFGRTAEVTRCPPGSDSLVAPP